MPAKIKVNVSGEVDLFPADLASAFWQLDSDEQAGFFNNLAAVAGSELPFQMQFVTDSRCLNAFGRIAMDTIGNFSQERVGTNGL